jgi:hypothetical protein
MIRKRILLLDEKTEKAISTVCDIALRFSGMHIATIVADVAMAIRDQSDDEDNEDW